MGRLRVLIFVGLAAGLCLDASIGSAASPRPQAAGIGASAADISAQARLSARRARTRIEIHPLPGPLRRECVPVFQERWIPQWGGWVLYSGQRCWWTRAPA
jgi:hypothetical protein